MEEIPPRIGKQERWYPAKNLARDKNLFLYYLHGQKMIILAAAVGANNELGRESGEPLWNLPDEYSRFRESIKYHPIIIGRKSYDVIKRPIPDSPTIVITRRKNYNGNGAIIAHSIGEAIQKANATKDIYIIGGGDIYNVAIKLADKIEISRINETFPGATAFFPEIPAKEWKLISSLKHAKDYRHAYSFAFETWLRK